MKPNWRRTTMAMVLGTLVAALGSSGCVVRARAGVTADVVDEQPPEPRRVVVRSHPGHIYVQGRWVWRDGRWVWNDGRYEVERSGQRWENGRWVRRGSRWHWVEGRWVVVSGGGTVVVRDHRDEPDHGGGGVVVHDHRDGGDNGGGDDYADEGGDYPLEAPPDPQTENVAPRQGYLWIEGHWEWKGGRYNWLPGHWERPRARKVWHPGHWEPKGRHYIWIEGEWVAR